MRIYRTLGKISIQALLKTLRTREILSVMVEGGARVIQSFLAESTKADASAASTRAVDSVIVTVAPILVGDDGVGYGSNVHGSEVSDLSTIMLVLLSCLRQTLWNMFERNSSDVMWFLP